MSRIHLHIDNLTLEGLGALDGASLRRAFERELMRLLGDASATTTWQAAEHASRDGGTIDVAPRATASAVGRSLGGAIFGAIATPTADAPTADAATGGKRNV